MSTTAQHVSLWSKSPALPMLETKPESRNTLIFLAGLSDTLATVPYLPRLADAIAPLDFSLVQPQLSSSLGGYGLSSLEADAQEICILVEHMLNREEKPKSKEGKIVIMGHSTGCQDVVHLLSQARKGVVVDGAILQAPVSDREYFEEQNPRGSAGQALLEEATSLFEKGKGSSLLSRDIAPPRAAPLTTENKVNGAAFQEPAMTAYRFWSLNAKGGDDDYFSSDLPEDRVAQIWRDAIDRGKRVLALLGEQDEYYPSHVSPRHLAAHWNKVVVKSRPEDDRFASLVLAGASHKVEDAKAQEELVSQVVAMLRKVVQDSRVEEAEDAPSSFEEVVELITNGKADSIPGVKNIPLKINEAKPSSSQMQRPAKPWEKASLGEDTAS